MDFFDLQLDGLITGRAYKWRGLYGNIIGLEHTCYVLQEIKVASLQKEQNKKYFKKIVLFSPWRDVYLQECSLF